MIDRLQWLHISDLHFREDGAEGDQFSQHVAFQAILRHLKEEANTRPKPNFVLITGDIAYSGKAQQYEVALKFFDELSQVLLIPPENFFFVPGNHDVDRSINGLAFDGACANCKSQQDVDRVLGGSDFSTLLERQQEFWSFVEALTKGQQRRYTQNRLAYMSQISIDGLKVSLLGLNSAWLCGRDGEGGKLLIGERQVINLIEFSEQADSVLCLGLAHHPVEWLYEWDQVTCRSQLLPKIDFYHRGHLHQPEVYLSSVPSSPCLSVAAGSGHVTRFFRNSYNMISLDLGSGECTVSQFEFTAEQGRYNHSKDTTAKISLKGKFPGDLETLYDVISQAIPSAHAYAGYMSGLLTGHFQEVPVHIAGMMVMMTPDAEDDYRPEEALAFLTLRNRLRLYEATTPLLDRIREHQVEIQHFAEHLQTVSKTDQELARQIIQKNSTGVQLIAREPIQQRSYAIELLDDLRESQDWATLEAQARRHTSSEESPLTTRAQFMLIEALIHSDQTEKQEEGASLAKIMIEQPTSGANEYLLAAGAAERVHDDVSASNLAFTMVSRWPENQLVGDYVRGLALRLGSRELREAADKFPLRGGVN